MTRLQLSLLSLCLFAAGCDPVQPVNPTSPLAALAAPSQVALVPSADTYLREWAPNQNQGGESSLKLQNAGNNRALLQWDPQTVAQSIGTGTLTGARIELTISDNGSNWGPRGRSIDLYRLNQAWSEGRATWNCAVDADLSNHRPDCSGPTAWDMDHPAAGSFAPTATASQTIRNGQTGTVAFDVTADVQAMVGGTGAKFGWILEKTDESLNGRVEFGSRESGAPPKLILSIAATQTQQKLVVLTDTSFTDTTLVQVTPYNRGAMASYDFRPRPGFVNPTVFLDDVPVSLSGTVVMDQDHILEASATKLHPVRSGSEPLVAGAHALLTAADPVSAFQEHINQVMSYLSTIDPAQVDDALSGVYGTAFDPVGDEAALDRLDEALGGHLFSVPTGSVSSAAPGMRVSAAFSTDSAELTTFMYINGVLTTSEKMRTTFVHLRTLVLRTEELDTPRTRIVFHYNPTRSEQELTGDAKRIQCLHEHLTFGSFKQLFDQCMQERRFAGEPDIVEAVRQWIDVAYRPGQLDQQGEMLLDDISSLREQGSHVILVAHSQGNLLVQQALQSMMPVPGDSTLLGVVALAAPTSSGWTLDENHLLGVTVSGDLVPNAGFSTWDRMGTPLTHVAASALSAVNFNPLHSLQEFVKWGLTLHAVDISYFGQPQVQAQIRDDLVRLYREATVGAVQCAFSGETTYPGRGRGLAKYVSVVNRNGRPLAGRKIAWSSSNPSVATVSSTGDVSTASPGTAVITAQSWQASCDITYEVVPVPNLAGTWVGTWDRSDFNGPATSGTLTLSLNQSGPVLSGTASYVRNGTSYSVNLIEGAVISPVGLPPQIHLLVPAAEYSQLGQGYALDITLTLNSAGVLNGVGPIWNSGTPTGETRHWALRSATAAA